MYPSSLKTSNKLWAKLFDLHPDKENIPIFTNPNKKKISKKTVLNFAQANSITGFKRKNIDIDLDLDEPNLPQLCNNIIKLQEESLNKDFTCDLCKEIALSCTALNPCSHKLCHECLPAFLKYASKCPLCSKIPKTSTQLIPPLNSKLTPEKIFYDDGSFYEGFLKNGKKEGKGNLTLKTGDIYNGIWLDDVLQSSVEIIYLDGNSTYKGEVKDFKRHGKGIFTCGDMIYDGFWENDRRNGWGKEINGVSSTYEGHWRNDKQHGHGKLKLNSGVFEGNWINGRISGYGAVSSQAKAQEEENKVSFLKKGFKGEYEGYWVNGEIEGTGMMIYADKTQYRGEWKNHKREGDGVLVMENGVSIQGKWKNDKIQVDVSADF